jgi:hypothetical protein
MDYTQLLNPSTPFEETKLQMLDTVTNTLYTTANNNDVRMNNNYLYRFK